MMGLCARMHEFVVRNVSPYCTGFPLVSVVLYWWITCSGFDLDSRKEIHWISISFVPLHKANIKGSRCIQYMKVLVTRSSSFQLFFVLSPWLYVGWGPVRVVPTLQGCRYKRPMLPRLMSHLTYSWTRMTVFSKTFPADSSLDLTSSQGPELINSCFNLDLVSSRDNVGSFHINVGHCLIRLSHHFHELTPKVLF